MSDSSKNIVLAIHGLGANSTWFEGLKNELEKESVTLYAFDLPGFGSNHSDSQPKGHIDSYQAWLDYIESKYQKLKAKYPDSRITILGHSLGGVIASNLKLDPGDKLVLSVPGFKGASATFNPWFTVKALFHLFVDKIIFKRDVYLRLPVSEKSQETPAATDPLRVWAVTQTLLYEILKLHKITRNNILKVEVPTLMIQVEDDQVVDNATQDEIFRTLNCKKELKIYTGTDHDWLWSEKLKIIAQELALWVKH